MRGVASSVRVWLPTRSAALLFAAAELTWLSAGTWVVPPIIASAYRGTSRVQFLNALITSQSRHPLEDYLSQWTSTMWWGAAVIGLAGATVILASNRRFQAWADRRLPALEPPSAITAWYARAVTTLVGAMGLFTIALTITGTDSWPISSYPMFADNIRKSHTRVILAVGHPAAVGRRSPVVLRRVLPRIDWNREELWLARRFAGSPSSIKPLLDSYNERYAREELLPLCGVGAYELVCSLEAYEPSGRDCSVRKLEFTGCDFDRSVTPADLLATAP